VKAILIAMGLPEAWATGDAVIDSFLEAQIREQALNEYAISCGAMFWDKFFFRKPQELGCIFADLRQQGASQEGMTRLVMMRDMDTSRVGGSSPLHKAAQLGNASAMATLLREGADPNAVKNNGATPLVSSVGGRAIPNVARVFRANNRDMPSVEAYVTCARMLLQHERFDLEQNDNDVCSPLWITVGNADFEPDEGLAFLKLLLTFGFNPNCRVRNQPALHMAVANKHLACAEALIQADADISEMAPDWRICWESGTYTEANAPLTTAISLCCNLHGKKAAQKLELAGKIRQSTSKDVSKEHRKLKSTFNTKDQSKRHAQLAKEAKHSFEQALEFSRGGYNEKALYAFKQALAHEGALSKTDFQISMMNVGGMHQALNEFEEALPQLRKCWLIFSNVSSFDFI
jgi:hypothetical protein